MSTSNQAFKIVYSSCRALLLPNIAAALSMTYLHRYLSFVGKANENDCPDDILLAAVIFIGCKTTENLRTVRDVFNAVSKIANENISANDLDKTYSLSKENIIAKEHEVLRVLSFNVEVDPPHKYMLNIARYMNLKQNPVRIAWSFLNDAYLSEHSATTRPEVVAAACLLLAIEVCVNEGHPAFSSSSMLNDANDETDDDDDDQDSISFVDNEEIALKGNNNTCDSDNMNATNPTKPTDKGDDHSIKNSNSNNKSNNNKNNRRKERSKDSSNNHRQGRHILPNWWRVLDICDTDILHAADWICQVCIDHSL